MSRFRVMGCAVVFALGCGGGKRSKCEKGWNDMKDLIGIVADKDPEAQSKLDAAKTGFLDMCEKLPDDVVDCIGDGVAMDKACKKKLKDAGIKGLKKKAGEMAESATDDE